MFALLVILLYLKVTHILLTLPELATASPVLALLYAFFQV